MWLLPYLSKLSGAAVRLYYRASRDGEKVPPTGPVLLVGNHPNALLDPAFLAWAAGRPVRFLAKAPLFRDRLIGWLIRGSGAIPVYRTHDDPTQVARNREAFRAVYDALGRGDAVAIFPEGISHSRPELAPLKTGAARIALGAVPTVGRAFAIMPIGLVFREKDRFRTEAHMVVGTAIQWDDLSLKTTADHDAVRELTDRIDRGMRAVTLNLARWEDESVVRTAESIWATVQRADDAPAARVSRLATTTAVLARMRASNDPHWQALHDDVSDHARNLAAIDMEPADVELDTGLRTAARWAIRRLSVVALLQAALAAIAVVVFWIPYRATGTVASLVAKDRDVVSTYRVIAGGLIFLLWIAALTAVATMFAGWKAGTTVAIAAPFVAIGGLSAIEHWEFTRDTARRWLLLRRRDPRIVGLRERQHDLAHRLDEALAAHPLD